MRIDVRRLAAADLVIAAGALDLATTPRLRAVLMGRIADGCTEVVLDLDRVTLVDARGAGMLAGMSGRIERAGGRFTVVGARGISLEVLAICGLEKRLHTEDEPPDILSRYGAVADTTDPYEPDPSLATRWPGSRDITAHGLLCGAAELPAEAPERAELRRQSIEDNMGLAERLARRFRDRGEPTDDLTQVGLIGLVQAVDGYDPRRGGEFVAYATPTIVGEIRRYFRDKGWRIKVPRRLQELRLQVNRARVELNQTMSAEPTVSDLAAHLGLEPAEVIEAIEVAQAYQPMSLSAPTDTSWDLGVADPMGDEDPGIEAVDNRESVKPLLAALPERERQILTLRYFREMTQSQIAEELGISQMHVSRLLSRTLNNLRTRLAA